MKSKAFILFLLSAPFLYCQNKIYDSGFNIGYGGSQINYSGNTYFFDGKPGFASDKSDFNYQDLGAYYAFDQEVSYWKAAKHNNEDGVSNPDWVSTDCKNNHFLDCDTYIPKSKGNFAVIGADFNCYNNGAWNIRKKYHEAIRTWEVNGNNFVEQNKTYIIKYKILPLQSINTNSQYIPNCFSNDVHLRI